jgi:hypothetical protein
MQQLTNPVDELLAQWEEIKYVSSHIGPNDDIDILDYMNRKGELMAYSQELRYARLSNNAADEAEYTAKFIEAYTTFSKDFIFRILKNGKART